MDELTVLKNHLVTFCFLSVVVVAVVMGVGGDGGALKISNAMVRTRRRITQTGIMI